MAHIPVLAPISRLYLLVLSITQIVVGILFVMTFIADIVMNAQAHFNCKSDDNSGKNRWWGYCSVVLVDSIATFTGVPIWGGILVALTGCLGLGSCVAKVKARRIGMRNGFQMMAILCTIVLTPWLFLIAAIDLKTIKKRYDGQYREDYIDSVLDLADKKKGLLGVIILLCVVEFIMAGISSVASCCCPVDVDEDDSDQRKLVA